MSIFPISIAVLIYEYPFAPLEYSLVFGTPLGGLLVDRVRTAGGSRELDEMNSGPLFTLQQGIILDCLSKEISFKYNKALPEGPGMNKLFCSAHRRLGP